MTKGVKREKMDSFLSLFQNLLEIPTSFLTTAATVTPIGGVVDLGGAVAIDDDSKDLGANRRRDERESGGGDRREVEVEV